MDGAGESDQEDGPDDDKRRDVFEHLADHDQQRTNLPTDSKRLEE
jgi:hypothetical protein